MIVDCLKSLHRCFRGDSLESSDYADQPRYFTQHQICDGAGNQRFISRMDMSDTLSIIRYEGEGEK